MENFIVYFYILLYTNVQIKRIKKVYTHLYSRKAQGGTITE